MSALDPHDPEAEVGCARVDSHYHLHQGLILASGADASLAALHLALPRVFANLCPMLSDGAQGAKVFADRYRRLGRLGTGGMATVFLAKDELLGREVAIKRLHSAAPEDLQQRFRREARLGAALNHPNIVAIFDSVTDEDSLYIVMEYVNGEALDARIDRGPIPPEQALAILEQSAAAIDYVHSEDIVHRDIKPSNLLVRDDGVVKVADLGIATAADLSQITASGSVMGTLPYIAPERLRGEDSGPPADIYSLGAVAFEMLAGRRPIEAKTPEEAVRLATTEGPRPARRLARGPAGAAEIIGDALAPDPSDRPSSAREMVDELERALGATGSSKRSWPRRRCRWRSSPTRTSPEPDEEPPTAEQDVAAERCRLPRPGPSRPRAPFPRRCRPSRRSPLRDPAAEAQDQRRRGRSPSQPASPWWRRSRSRSPGAAETTRRRRRTRSRRSARTRARRTPAAATPAPAAREHRARARAGTRARAGART